MALAGADVNVVDEVVVKPEIGAVVDKLVNDGIGLVREKFDGVLDFHDSGHTKGVVEDAEWFARMCGGDARTIGVARVAAAYHDGDQDWERARNRADTLEIRRRFGGDNERKSAAGAVARIRET